jgi:hypothetical protein
MWVIGLLDIETIRKGYGYPPNRTGSSTLFRLKLIASWETHCRVMDKKLSGSFINRGNILWRNSTCVALYSSVFPGWKYRVNIRRLSLHASPYGMIAKAHFQPTLTDDVMSERHNLSECV